MLRAGLQVSALFVFSRRTGIGIRHIENDVDIRAFGAVDLIHRGHEFRHLRGIDSPRSRV